MVEMVEWNNGEVDIRDPRPDEYFRVNPEPGIPVFVVLDEGQYYVVTRDMVAKVEEKRPGLVKPATLHMCMNTKGDLFFWPIETKHDSAA